MPDPIKQEPEAKDSPLAALNKLIFRMDASSTAEISCLPRAEYQHSKMASAIQTYQEAKADMEAKLAAIDPPLAETAAIKAKMATAFEKLEGLNADLGGKFDDWMKNKRAMDKQAVWDPAFKDVNSSFAALHDEINNAAKQNPTNEGLKELQGSAKVLNADNLQNKVFKEEVSRLTTMLNEQSRSDYGFKVAHELGYSGPKKQLWKKLHSTDADKVEKKAEEKMAADEAAKNPAHIGPAAKDENWVDRLNKKGGPGIYRQPGSDYYIKVGKDATLTAVFSPEDTSFLSKLAYLVVAPLAMVAAAASFLIPFVKSEEKDKFRSSVSRYLWNSSTFEKGFGELIDFATIDPSGMMKSKSIEMFYDDYKHIGKKQAQEILQGLKAAEKRGIGFDITPELADALIASKDIKQSVKDEIFKKIEDYKISFLAKEKAMEAKGEASMQQKVAAENDTTKPKPAPGDTTTSTVAALPTNTTVSPTMTPAEVAALEANRVELEKTNAALAAANGNAVTPAIVASAAATQKMVADNPELAGKIPAANEQQSEIVQKAVDAARNNADLIKVKLPEADAAAPGVPKPELIDEWAAWLDKVDAVVVERLDELPLQRDLEQAVVDMGAEGLDPERYAQASETLRTVLEDAVYHLKGSAETMSNADSVDSDVYAKTDALKSAIDLAAGKLDPVKDKILLGEYKAAAEEFDNVPRPAASPSPSSR
jgi:hypothetical protein